MNQPTQLLVGCGTARDKRMHAEGEAKDWTNLTTLDIDPAVKPTVVHNLEQFPYPFMNNSFNEIHAYECLEHTGRQGDWRFFFDQFHEFWRILKPDGYLFASVPMWDSPWAWADPAHTRVINKFSLIFLNREEYSQVGRTAMTDYSDYWKGNFRVVASQEGEHNFGFVLQAIK